MLRIRFGGFSVLKTTKGLRQRQKANWVEKLAHIGGTAGLFIGVSFVICSIVKCMMSCMSKENKVEILEDVEAEPSNGNENKIDNLKKKVDNNTLKFDDMERRLIVHDHTIIEENQNFEKEIFILKKNMDAMDNKVDVMYDKIDAIANKMDAMNNKMMEVMEKIMGGK